MRSATPIPSKPRSRNSWAAASRIRSRFWATSVGQRNVELAKRLGADVAIDYRRARFEEVARDCDVVLDSAGGDTLVRCFECVKPGGVVVSIGSTPVTSV